MCGPLLSLFIVLHTAGCRQLAGYGSSDLFEEQADTSTPPDAGDMPDEGTPGTDDSGSEAEASEIDREAETDASEEMSTMDVGESDAPNETTMTDGGNDGGTVNDGDLADAEADVTQESEAGEGGTGDAGPCDPQPPKSGSNLVTNADFEAASMAGAGWSGAYGAMFSVSSTHAHCGTQSGAVTARTAPFHAAEYAIVLPEGGTFSYSVWVDQEGTDPLGMALQWYSSNSSCSNMFGPAAYTAVAPKTWTRLTGTLTIPTGCATTYLYVVQQFPNGASCALAGSDAGVACPDIYVDDLYVIQ